MKLTYEEMGWLFHSPQGKGTFMEEQELNEMLRKVREVAEFGGDYWYSMKRFIDRIHSLVKGIKEKGTWPPSRLPGPPPPGIALQRGHMPTRTRGDGK